jgi:hypothetical protein
MLLHNFAATLSWCKQFNRTLNMQPVSWDWDDQIKVPTC